MSPTVNLAAQHTLWFPRRTDDFASVSLLASTALDLTYVNHSFALDLFFITIQAMTAQAPPLIFAATAACRSSFEECLLIDRLMDHEWAENRLADFNLWAAGIGASAGKDASLDQRLVFKPDVRDVIVNLLYMLKAFVEQCQEQGKLRERNQIFHLT
jgi:hypothetical protein